MKKEQKIKTKNLFVYYDPEYDPNCTRKFISQNINETIVDFLKNKGFIQLNAEKIKEEMLKVVKGEMQNVVIVFAQDVAPDTILDDPFPTALVRQYLDNGGSIIWIGDIPFFYQATEKGLKRNDHWWKTGAAGNILGVNPTFPTRIKKNIITKAGESKGIKIPWTGIRPVIIDKEIEELAITRALRGSTHQSTRPNWFLRTWYRLRGVDIGAGGFIFGVQLDQDSQTYENFVFWNKVLATAWFKNFDRRDKRSGFYRIWDYRPSELSQEQLNDLNRLAMYIVHSKHKE